LSSDSAECRVCESHRVEEIPEFRDLRRVTSDCVPFGAGGRLLVCGACGAAQSPADRQWFDEISQIYSVYRSFQQYGGPEQHVLDAATGTLRRRSQVLADRLSALAGFPQTGRLLDVGCGGGATLQAFSERGAWRLFGHEIDDRNLPLLRSIPGFEGLFTGELNQVPGQFDAVAMVHSLEHFPAPVPALRDLHRKIVPGGRLFVQVPDAEANPFEYLVADHMVHFTTPTLCRLANRGGFAVECVSTAWVSKELSLTARPSEESIPLEDQPGVAAEVRNVRARIAWLVGFIGAAQAASAGCTRFGLFGSTIAATWLAGVLGDAVSFFVEEDVNRAGSTHMGRPIFHPAQVPAGSVVYVALIPRIGTAVRGRWGDSLDLRMPPEWSGL
jgi:SAM-dependent methyltransferase